MSRRLAATLFVALVLGATAGGAQPTTAAAATAGAAPATVARPEGTWRVATREVPPFAFRDDDGTWHGLSVDLWRSIAAEHGFTTEWVETDLETMIDGVADGRFDAAVGAVTVTAERETRIDFSQPFFSGGLGIVAAERGGGWIGGIRRLLSPAFWRVVAALAVLLLIAGLLAWLFERRRNAEQFGGSVAHGIGAGFWWAAVTMTTVGYGDKSPVTLAGRILGLVWMFASLIVISTFTAAITSALTVGQLAAAVERPEDLPTVRVASLVGTTGAEWLEAADIAYVAYPSTTAALEALVEDRLDALVYDQAILQHLVKAHYPGELTVLPQVLATELYAFVLPPGSPHREAIDRSLLRHVMADDWQARLTFYLDR